MSLGRRLGAAMLLVAAGRLAAAKPPGIEGWAEVLAEQLARYPAMQAEDVYKLAHQATFGPAHLIVDAAAARGYLLSELAGVAADSSEPLVETLSVEPPLVRVNLRPFKARGADPEALVAALVRTASDVAGDPAALRARLEVAVEVLGARGKAAEAGRLKTLAAELEAQGFPAVHHSRVYSEAYRPAYRVVRLDLLVLP